MIKYYIYTKIFPINYFCCLRDNMDGDVLYLPLSLPWNSLLCVDPRDTYWWSWTTFRSLCSAPDQNHTSVLNQISWGRPPCFQSAEAVPLREQSPPRQPDSCTVFLQIWSLWGNQEYTLIFIWGNGITYMFTCNGILFKETWPRNARILTR